MPNPSLFHDSWANGFIKKDNKIINKILISLSVICVWITFITINYHQPSLSSQSSPLLSNY